MHVPEQIGAVDHGHAGPVRKLERLPPGIRESLSHDYEAVQAMLDKIEHGHLHLSVFGRVSTGKSSLLASTHHTHSPLIPDSDSEDSVSFHVPAPKTSEVDDAPPTPVADSKEAVPTERETTTTWPTFL